MPENQTRTECANCGTIIDTSIDTSEDHTPCPKCGSKKRRYFCRATNMQPTNYYLDKFVAPKLSALTDCGAKELSVEANWLIDFIQNSVNILNLEDETRAYLFNFLHRMQGAIFTYQQAHSALLEYTSTERTVISPYFRALLNFEICISQCYLGYKLLSTSLGKKLYEQGDGSDMERLNFLYTDFKHLDSRIDKGEIPTHATTAVWITNQGFESSKASLTFDELHDLLLNMIRLAKKLNE